MDQIETREGMKRILMGPPGWWLGIAIICFLLLPIVADLSDFNLATSVYLGQMMSLFAACGFWLGFGRSRSRYLIAFAAGCGLALVGTVTLASPQAVETFVLFLVWGAIVAAIVAIPIGIARKLRNGELLHVSSHTGDESATNDVLQFSIARLFAITTAFAVLMVAAKYLFPMFSAMGGRDWLIVSKLGVTLGIGSIVAVWATLGHDALFRSIASVVVGAALITLNYWIINSNDRILFSLLTAVCWTNMTVLMWLVRSVGYRFVSTCTPENA